MMGRHRIKDRISYGFLISLVLFIWIVLTSSPASAAQPFELHLLDVGQGLGVLIEADGHYMLIDGGGRKSSSFVVSYMKQQEIDHFDMIALSHYDEDHMSGEIGVLSVFPDETLLLPSYEGEGDLYQSFCRAAITNGAEILHPHAGEEYRLGNATVSMIGPARTDYELVNDRSLALRITYGDVSCIICGDAEQTAEMEMASSGEDLSADVYVANHHGSRTSSTDDFLDAVAPDYALISCGRDNSYGHPAEEALQRLHERGIQIYRTDLQGTIILYSDGDTYWFNQDPCQDWTPGTYKAETRQLPANGDTETTGIRIDEGDTLSEKCQYICNTNTGKFHYPECPSVEQMKEKNRLYSSLSREELIAQGYQPCGNCNP